MTELNLSYRTTGGDPDFPQRWWVVIGDALSGVETVIPVDDEAMAIKTICALRNDDDRVNERIKLSEQVIEAWNTVICYAEHREITEDKVVPLLLELFQRVKDSEVAGRLLKGIG